MIDLNLTLILTEAAIFLFLLVVLNKILIGPIVAHVDARNKSIKDGLGSVSQNSHEVAELERQADEIIKNAKTAAQELRNKKLSIARKSVHDKIEARKITVEEELRQFNDELQAKRVDLKNALLGQAPLFKESLKVKLISSSSN